MEKFFKDRIAELNAITWPTQKQAIHAGITVLTVMGVVGIILTLMDFGLSELINTFILKIS